MFSDGCWLLQDSMEGFDMEGNTKKETTEKDNSPASGQNGQNTPRKGGLTGWMDSINSRSAIVMLIAGLYLAYLGWGLCKGYIDKAEGSGIGFFCVGAAFILIGVFMLFAGGRVTIKTQNRKKEEAEAEMKNTGASEEAPAEKKPMSISERAALASREDDFEENPENEENAEK